MPSPSRRSGMPLRRSALHQSAIVSVLPTCTVLALLRSNPTSGSGWVGSAATAQSCPPWRRWIACVDTMRVWQTRTSPSCAAVRSVRKATPQDRAPGRSCGADPKRWHGTPRPGERISGHERHLQRQTGHLPADLLEPLRSARSGPHVSLARRRPAAVLR